LKVEVSQKDEFIKKLTNEMEEIKGQNQTYMQDFNEIYREN
jgi:hypothetical protein